jgi:uncharacterized protein YjbK
MIHYKKEETTFQAQKNETRQMRHYLGGFGKSLKKSKVFMRIRYNMLNMEMQIVKKIKIPTVAQRQKIVAKSLEYNLYFNKRIKEFEKKQINYDSLRASEKICVIAASLIFQRIGTT